MPLARTHVTAASRAMLPTYPVFFIAVGLSFTLTPVERLVATPGLRFADGFVPVGIWGLGFLAVATVLVAALLAHRRRVYQVGLGVAIVWLALWALILAISAFASTSSFTAWIWPAFVARACWASLVSLEVQER